jgi:uncharacterized protein (DUF2461 family)
MTLLQKALNHYIAICSRSTNEKLAGWQCAQELAEKYPAELSDLPQRLTAEMKTRQKSGLRLIEGGKNEIRKKD